MLKRRAARASYLSFIEQTTDLKPAAHHKLLIRKLQAVVEGQIKRLMVFMPPGSAKSWYANVHFSPYYLGRHPENTVITASYGSDLAEKWGRRSRNIVASEEYSRIFQISLDASSSAANRWATTAGGEYLAVGVGGPVTGNRADLAVIDDPVKGREEAESETIRAKTKEWYRDDLWTRLKPEAAIILIMTRWHEDDLAGWLLEEAKRGGEQWEVISLPALAESNDPLGRAIGEPLWPEWFTEAMFAEAKRDPRRWSALYQQRPSPEEGDYFRKEWIRWYDAKPAHLKTYGASDYAVTADGGDYTVHGVCGIDPDDNLYVLDWWRNQTTTEMWIEAMLDMMHRHKTLKWAEEAGQIEKSVGPFIHKRQLERKVYGYREQYVSSRDKPTRARSFQARMAMGKVYFPRNAPWVSDLISEMLMFPSGKNDDQIDVLGLFGRMLDEMAKGRVPDPPEKNIFDTMSPEWKEHFEKRARMREEI